MNVAEILAAIDRCHPIDRERIAARMLEHASGQDFRVELRARYRDGDTAGSTLAACRWILTDEAAQERLIREETP